MNPLTAIRALVSPELRPLPWPQAGAETPGLAPIPLREIQELPLELNLPPLAPASGADESFGNVLGRLVGEVNGRQAAAGDAVRGLLGGQNVSLHQAMIAMEEANVSFQLMVEVRNKLLESYQELMRMQI